MEHKKEEWLEKMQVAAFLPPNDSERKMLEKEIGNAEEWVRRMWLNILTEDEDLRLQCQNTRTPEFLKERLLNIPNQPSQKDYKKWLSLAACVLLGIFLSLSIPDKKNKRTQLSADQNFHNFSTLAVNEYFNESQSEYTREEDFKLMLKKEFSFNEFDAVKKADYQFTGGRLSYWGGLPVVCSQWSKGDDKQTILFLVSDVHINQLQDEPYYFNCCGVKLEDKVHTDIVFKKLNKNYIVLVAKHGLLEKQKGKPYYYKGLYVNKS